MLTSLLMVSKGFGELPTNVDVWEINTRHLPASFELDVVSSAVTRHFDSGRWEESRLDELGSNLKRQTDQPAHTIVYVHGNWTSDPDARTRGIGIAQRLAPLTDDQVNVVVYSWPSERERGFAKDILQKRARLDVESLYLSKIVRSWPAQPCSYVGFSFGGAVICGSLQLQAGGRLSGHSLEAAESKTLTRAKVALLAPAFDRRSLGPRGKYALANNQIESMCNLFNSEDPVLKRFRLIERHADPIAAGYAGIPSSYFPISARYDRQQLTPLRQWDCRNSVGRTHSEWNYYRKCPEFSLAVKSLLGLGEGQSPTDEQPAQLSGLPTYADQPR